MSIKKTIALTFLLFAGTVILAHSVIPHHYHNGIPFVTVHHEYDGNLHDRHPHNQKESIDDCFFATVYVRLNNDQQITIQSLDFDFDLLPCFLTLFSDYFICKIEKSQHKPYLLPYHIEYISQSLGLRAPPVC